MTNGPNGNDDKAIERVPVPMSRRGLQLNTMDDAWRFAQCCRRTEMFANKFKSDEECFLAVEMACELGVPPLMGIQHIAVIGGRAFAETHLLMAAVQQAGVMTDYAEGVELPNGKLDDEAYGWVKLRRAGGPVLETRYSVKQAKSANLMGKQNWKSDPEHMLVTRALSRGLRRHFADICLGAYTVEEADEIMDNSHDSTGRVDDLRNKLGLPPKATPFDPDKADGATLNPPIPATDAEIKAAGGLMVDPVISRTVIGSEEEMAAAEHVGKTTLMAQSLTVADSEVQPAPEKPKRKKRTPKPKPEPIPEEASAQTPVQAQDPPAEVEPTPPDAEAHINDPPENPTPGKGANVRHSHVASLLGQKLGCDPGEAANLRDSWLDLMGYDAESLKDDDVWAKIQGLIESADWTKLQKALGAMA